MAWRHLTNRWRLVFGFKTRMIWRLTSSFSKESEWFDGFPIGEDQWVFHLPSWRVHEGFPSALLERTWRVFRLPSWRGPEGFSVFPLESKLRSLLERTWRVFRLPSWRGCKESNAYHFGCYALTNFSRVCGIYWFDRGLNCLTFPSWRSFQWFDIYLFFWGGGGGGGSMA